MARTSSKLSKSKATRKRRRTTATGVADSKKIAAFVQSAEGVFVPAELASPVPASKLEKGFKKAKDELRRIVADIASLMTEEYAIREIELVASFSADGKFLGIGVGGAASVKIRIAPKAQKKSDQKG